MISRTFLFILGPDHSVDKALHDANSVQSTYIFFEYEVVDTLNNN